MMGNLFYLKSKSSSRLPCMWTTLTAGLAAVLDNTCNRVVKYNYKMWRNGRKCRQKLGI